MKKKNKHIGPSFESFLKDEGIYEEVQLSAVKNVIALAIQKAMEQYEISKTEMAKRIGTSRAALNRLLDPDNHSVTLHTLQRAAKTIGKNLEIHLT